MVPFHTRLCAAQPSEEHRLSHVRQGPLTSAWGVSGTAGRETGAAVGGSSGLRMSWETGGAVLCLETGSN